MISIVEFKNIKADRFLVLHKDTIVLNWFITKYFPI